MQRTLKSLINLTNGGFTMKSYLPKESNEHYASVKISVNAAQKWLRNHVQKGEKYGSQAACIKFHLEKPEEVYAYIMNCLYPNDSTGSDFVEALKKNDSLIHKRQKSQTRYIPSALQEKLKHLNKDVACLEKQRSGILSQCEGITKKLKEDTDENEAIKKQLEELAQRAKAVNERLTLGTAQIKNLKSNLVSVETAIEQKNAEIEETLKQIEEEKAMHVSMIELEGVEIYTGKLPDMSEKFNTLMELLQTAECMEDSFTKELLNSTAQAETLLAAEYLYCYRKVCENNERKVYWHVPAGEVADLLDQFPKLINLVVEK